MKVILAKVIVRYKQKYAVPARYSSTTCLRIYVDGPMVGSDIPVSNYGGFKKAVKNIKELYIRKYGNEIEFFIDSKPFTCTKNY